MIFVGFLLLIITLLVAFGLYVNEKNRMIVSPLKTSVNYLQVEATEVHLWIQNMLEGQPIVLDGVITGPESWETGFKDTVIAYPHQVTRIRGQFNTPGQFVWHCHIVEHEDNEMMRPFRIGPKQPGQPGFDES